MGYIGLRIIYIYMLNKRLQLQTSSANNGKQKRKMRSIFSACQANVRLGDLAGTCKGGGRVWVPATFETGTHKEVVNKNREAKSSEKTKILGNFSYNAIR